MKITSSIAPMFDGEYDIDLTQDTIKNDECFPKNFDELQAKAINFHIWDNNKLVAYMEVYTMRVSENLVDIADGYNTDLSSAMMKLFITSKHLDTEHADKHSTYGYIHLLYVAPEYRKKGIGTFLLNNLPDILEIHHHITDLVMVGICKQITDIDIDENNEVHTKYNHNMTPEDVNNLRIMGATLKATDFKLCTKTDNRWYYKRY